MTIGTARFFCLFGVLLLFSTASCFAAAEHGLPQAAESPLMQFPPSPEIYGDESGMSLGQILAHRISVQPFNAVATLIFILAILHTFLAGKLAHVGHNFEVAHRKKIQATLRTADPQDDLRAAKEPVSMKATVFHFLGEIEAIFGLWTVPLLGSMALWVGWLAMGSDAGASAIQSAWEVTTGYLDTRHFNEPLFVVIIMCAAATRPILRFAEALTGRLAKLGGGTPGAWWFAALSLLPLLGSFITEPAAMTIAAMILARKFYDLEPSPLLKYATLGLLFTNVSVGGTLTHFAAPPVLMVAAPWHLDLNMMLLHVGWKALIGIVIATSGVGYFFRKEFRQLAAKQASLPPSKSLDHVPVWLTVVHLLFLAWAVLTMHHPPLLVGGFLFFLAFLIATAHHQLQMNLRGPLMVGFFLAGLVVHGSLQSWWLSPVLSMLPSDWLFPGAAFLTAFNDNAAITYLASQVPDLNPALSATPEQIAAAHALQYRVLTGAVVGGGLTVIANAPNPAGQNLLHKYFKDGIQPLWLFAGAIGPTIFISLIFRLWPTF